MRHTVYVTHLLPEPVMREIRQRYRLLSEPTEEAPTDEARRKGFAEADAVICTLSDRVDDQLLSLPAHLKIVANYAVGYNNIDLAAAEARGIIVTNTPDVLTDATADLTWALILAVTRRVVEGDRLVRAGQWSGWAPTHMLSGDVTGRTLGVIGMGRIGQAVARRATGFRMPVIYASHRPASPPDGLPWRHRSHDEVVAESDFLSLHVPLTETTRHLIGAKELAHMKRTAFLINTSRGPVVDEAALVHALKTGAIAGAGLDVYEQEPAVHPELLAMPQVVLLPHLGSATHDTRIRMGMMCLENIDAVFSGRPAPNRVRTAG